MPCSLRSCRFRRRSGTGSTGQRVFSDQRRHTDRGRRGCADSAAGVVACRGPAPRGGGQFRGASIEKRLGMRGQDETNSEMSGGVSTARRWAEYLLAVLGGNIIYLAIEPQLPALLRHRMFQIDLGLALDFLICVALYGLVRLARGSGHRSG